MADTTKKAAAASRQRQAARQRRSPTARRAAGPPGSAAGKTTTAPSTTDGTAMLPLMISTVLPDEAAQERREQDLRSGLLRRAQADGDRGAKWTVTLNVALADLPAGERTVEVRADPVGMSDTALDCLSRGGWPALQDLIRSVQALRVGELTTIVYASANEVVAEIVPQLAEVEELAREIVLDRLAVSEEQVAAACAMFLLGPGVGSLPVSYLSSTRRRLTLKPGAASEALRSMLDDLGPTNRMAERFRQEVRSNRAMAARAPHLEAILDRSLLKLRAFQQARAERVALAARHSPLVSWLVGTDPAVTDQAVVGLILDELKTVTDAVAEVRGEVAEGGAWPTDTLSAEQANAGLQSVRLFLGAGLTNPFTRNMLEPRGPWRYPMMIDAALEELGHRTPSAVAAAAHSVTGGSTEYQGLNHLMTGTVLAVSLAAPPVGVALGVATALWNLYSDATEYGATNAAHRACLDPARSLAVPPSFRDVEASIIGLLGSAVPGLVPAIAFGAAEVIMRIKP
ncbi:hypothetical protein AB0368_08995 [Actinoplanes sp. NPDC051475]|uniref:hypothetical protein n=1 Tax=Actinoplanes sp. NPDC051475 TaxID=3157225 RepID=UPI003450F6A2